MLKIRFNLIFILKKKNLKEEFLLLQGCAQERRPFFFLDLSLLGKNFSSLIFCCITNRKASVWYPKISKKILQNPFKNGGEEERWHVDVGASNSWTPPSVFGDKKEMERCPIFYRREERVHPSFGAWDLTLKEIEL